jgi:multidrug efflux pump subunit AcrB
MRTWLNPQQMTNYGFTPQDVIQAIESQGRRRSGRGAPPR